MVVGRGEPLEWKFSQVFGERAPGEPINDVDIISAVEFDKSGNYLAVGDHGGRLIIFERTNMEGVQSSDKESEKLDSPAAMHPIYAYKTEFLSHGPEFDYLNSLEIEEKINQLRWLTSLQNSSFILTTNPKTIKLWKVTGRKIKKVKEINPNPHICAENAILAEKSFVNGLVEQVAPSNYRLEWRNKKPKHMSTASHDHFLMTDTEEGTSRCRKVYAHAHEYNINSISVNSDRETFLSADDLRINLWNVDIRDQCFNIIDIKPPKMEDLMEVITSAEFHPTYCNLLAYSSSRGFIRLVDMRQSALCDQSAKILRDCEAHTSQSLFTEIIRSISDIKFTNDGMCILSRDYMNLKLWDMRMENLPVVTFKIHEYLHPKLPELYNSDSVFDKFECCSSPDGLHFASGSYSNIFRVFSLNSGSEDQGTTWEASKNPSRIPIHANTRAPRLLPNFTRGHNRRGMDRSGTNGSSGVTFDTSSKVISLAWHPTSNLIACAAANSLYMYHS